MSEAVKLARKLIVLIDDELDKEMCKYSEVDWVDAVKKSIKNYINNIEIGRMYTVNVEEAF